LRLRFRRGVKKPLEFFGKISAAAVRFDNIDTSLRSLFIFIDWRYLSTR